MLMQPLKRVSLIHIAREGFARERRGIDRRTSAEHNRIQRHASPGLMTIISSTFTASRSDFFQNISALHIRVIRTDVHQPRNRLTRLIHCVILKQFTHLIKQHDRDRLGKIANDKRANGGKAHQKVFVKHLTAQDVANRTPEHIPADDEIRREERHEAKAGCLPHASQSQGCIRRANQGLDQPFLVLVEFAYRSRFPHDDIRFNLFHDGGCLFHNFVHARFFAFNHQFGGHKVDALAAETPSALPPFSIFAAQVAQSSPSNRHFLHMLPSSAAGCSLSSRIIAFLIRLNFITVEQVLNSCDYYS